MKIYWLFIFLIALSCGSNSNEFITLSGSVENIPASGFVQLEKVIEEGIETVDSIKINQNGGFEEKITIDEPAFYRLNFNDRQYVSLILNGTETEVSVNAHGNDPRGYSEVSGSYDTEFKNRMDDLIQQYQQQRSQYQQQQIAARNAQDYEAFNEAANNMLQMGIRTEKKLKGLIREASTSLAAIYGIQMLDQDSNVEFIDSVANQLVAEIPQSFHVRNLVNLLESKKSLIVGAEAPDFSLPNPDGELISLHSLRGKYVLIDFWAAWCRPCRAENPNVVRLYNEYADENFEILGVSLDKTKDAWTNAIAQDGLPWLHVSDLKFWRSEAALAYQVKAIPATYLIDPEGKIIGKNLRGPSLVAKLKEIFG